MRSQKSYNVYDFSGKEKFVRENIFIWSFVITAFTRNLLEASHFESYVALIKEFVPNSAPKCCNRNYTIPLRALIG